MKPSGSKSLKTLAGLRRLLGIGSLIVFVFMVPAAIAESRSNQGKKNVKHMLTKGEKFEIQFLTKSLDRHARIIEEMQQVDSLTSNVQVIAFAHAFIARENVEMTTMSSLLDSWYQVIYTPPIKSDASYWAESENFDLEIIDSVIGYDHCEIAFNSQVTRQGFHSEIKKLTSQMTMTSKAEIQMLKSWLRAWENDGDGGENQDN